MPKGVRPEGSSEQAIRFNVYAFGVEVELFTRKRDRARTETMRKKWQWKIDFATSCLNENSRWLSEIAEADLCRKGIG